MGVAVDEQPQALRPRIRVAGLEVAPLVRDHEAQTSHLAEGLGRQLGAEISAVAIASHRGHRRHERQFPEHRAGAHVAGVDDEVGAGARLEHATVDPTVRVRDHSDTCFRGSALL